MKGCINRTVLLWAGLPILALVSPALAKDPPAKASAAKANGQLPAVAGTPLAAKAQTLAVVNGEEISREEVARDSLSHYGKEILESLVNKHLIAQELKRQGKQITQDDVEKEIDQTARRCSLNKEQFLSLLEREKGMSPHRYALDVVWPTVALRMIASSRLRVSDSELAEGYESQFGAAVQARLIVVDDEKQADSIHAKLNEDPDSFPRLAKQYSKDSGSAQAGGMIQPIRKHLGDPGLEQAAFALTPGEVSPVVRVRNQYAILRCEALIPAVSADRATVDPLLKDAIRDRKLRKEAAEVFRELQNQVAIINVYNTPAAAKEFPGVAAIVRPKDPKFNIPERQFTLTELADECIARHGVEVLDGIVNRHILEQACKKRGLTLTQADLDAELDRAAVSMGFTLSNGKADRDGWIKHITTTENISQEMYVRDLVWPSAALKAIVGEKITVTEEDIQRGFEANYGPRVRVRAIMLHNQRKAQEVWDKARDNPSVENFSRLARNYSIDANSASLGGEVPPIQKHGGQPVLEREAFKLQPGELSGIIQVGEQFIVMLCEGYTKPVEAKLEEVQEFIREDVHEKRLRAEMAKKYKELQDNATIDNYLAGTLKNPNKDQQSLVLDPQQIQHNPGSATRKR